MYSNRGRRESEGKNGEKNLIEIKFRLEKMTEKKIKKARKNETIITA